MASPKPKKESSSGQHLVYKYLIAASLAALVISTFASWFFYSKWEESEDHYVEILRQKSKAEQELTFLRSEYESLYSDLMILHDPNFKVISLIPADTSLKAVARIFWNPYTRETFLDPLSLPAPDSGLQYQVWSFADKVPQSAGLVIDHRESDRLYRINDVAVAQSWAISLEPHGGSQQPTEGSLMLVQR